MIFRVFLSSFVLLLGSSASDAWLMPCRRLNTVHTTSQPSCRSPKNLRMMNRMMTSEPKYSASLFRIEEDRTQLFGNEGSRRRRRRRLRFLIGAAALALIATLFPSRSASAAVEAITTAAAAPIAAAAPAISPVVIGPFGMSSGPILSRTMEFRLAFRLLYAGLVGGCVGWERSSTNHSAGVRTMALVSLGAAAFTICSIYGFAGSVGGRFDPSRMASNVASGVGFIGAGVITTHQLRAAKNRNDAQLQHSSVVHGLTTAAAIWISAAIGVASGVGLYYIAGTATAATVAILRFGRVKKKLRKRMVHHVVGASSSSLSQQHQEPHHPNVPLSDLVVPEQDVQEPDLITSSLSHDLSTWDEEVLKKTATPVVGDGMAHSFRRDRVFDRYEVEPEEEEEEYEEVVEDDDVMEVAIEDEDANVSQLMIGAQNQTEVAGSYEQEPEVEPEEEEEEYEEVVEDDDVMEVAIEDEDANVSQLMIGAQNQTEAAGSYEEEPEFPEILMQTNAAVAQNQTESFPTENTPPADMLPDDEIKIVEVKHIHKSKDPSLYETDENDQEVEFLKAPTPRRTTTEDRGDLSP